MNRNTQHSEDDYLAKLGTNSEIFNDASVQARLLWVLAKVQIARPLCQRLVASIQKEIHVGFHEVDLGVLSLCLNALHAYDVRLIDGATQAQLIERLVASEVQPGGPYRNIDGNVHSFTNVQICLLIASIAKPLPGLKRFEPAAQQWLAKHIEGKALESEPPLVVLAKKARDVHISESESDFSPRDKNKEYLYNAAMAEVTTLRTPYLQPQVLKAIQSLKKVDKTAEVALLPLMYVQSLQTRPAFMTDALCRELGIANIFCWVAYTIFDDFIDAEGIAATMPVAAYAQRTMLHKYMDIMETEQAYQLISCTFTTMDEANSWELNHCRATITDGFITIESIPDFDNLQFLYRRSLGHALGPLLLQSRDDPARVPAVKQAFCDYLIARQLNDDLHDWATDLEDGHISPVVTCVLNDAGIGAGTYELAKIMPSLRRAFWEVTAETVSKITLRHCRLARQGMNQGASLRPGAPILQLITRLEGAIARSVHTKKDGEDFMRNWKA